MNTQHQAIVSQLQPLLTQFVTFPKAVTNQELAQCESELRGTLSPHCCFSSPMLPVIVTLVTIKLLGYNLPMTISCL